MVRVISDDFSSEIEPDPHSWGPQDEKPNTVVRAYTGKENRALELFRADAAKLAKDGYFPINQTYVPGSWGCGAFVIALLLCIVLIGVLVFIYMLIVKPDGTLTVTYQLGETTEAEKACPMCAEKVKSAALVCRFCGHRFDSASPSAESGS